MADEQRVLATESAADPAETPEPEATAATPDTEPTELAANPHASAATAEPVAEPATPADGPVVPETVALASVETTESGMGAAAPDTEIAGAEAGAPPPAVETIAAGLGADGPGTATGAPETGVPVAPDELAAPLAATTEAADTLAAAPAAAAEGADGLVAPEEQAADEEDEPPTKRQRTLTFFREFVETILLTLVIFVAVRTLVVNFRVDGESMRPTLLNGEYLLVNRATYFHLDLNALRDILPGPDRQGRDVVYLFGPPRRGDIIVFEPPIASDKPFVKRVIGLPGDTIAVHEDHRVYVNDQPIDERYIAAPPRNLYPPGGGSYTVPPGMIFVMGDNRNNSEDSRIFGAVSLDSVIGKAVISYWPLDVFGFLPHERYALAGDGH